MLRIRQAVGNIKYGQSISRIFHKIFQQNNVISVSGHCLCFIFKIRQTVAGIKYVWILNLSNFFILIFYRFLNIWPKCEVAAAAATRPFKTELVGHWGESNLAAAHQTAAVFEPQRRKKTILWPPRELVLVLLSLGRLGLEPQKKVGRIWLPLCHPLSHSFF